MEEIKNFEDVCNILSKPYKQIKFIKVKRFCNRFLFCRFDLGYSPEQKVHMIGEALNCVHINWTGTQPPVFKSEGMAKWAAKTFEKEYKEYFRI